MTEPENGFDHDRLSTLFHRGLELPPERRQSFLDRECPDPLMREELEGMFKADASDHDLLSVSGKALQVITHELFPSQPVRVGDYDILDFVDEGGMGAVYRAQREGSSGVVALKVIRHGYASPSVMKRFDFEVSVLGRLNHPGIAKILDAGTALIGSFIQPFFVMEFIEGQELLKFVQAEDISLRDRMEMMARICDATHHAHQKGVIHRDLKPSNILVDKKGQPKILDFGIAKSTDADLEARRGLQSSLIPGTPSYMSPEQVSGDRAALDTRSDVYALGVTMYELLSFELPYRIASYDEARTILDTSPVPLGSRDKRLKGDIETIVAKALRKERQHRYSSASDLARDIRRYLKDQPIEARPPSTAYLLRKFAKRHRATVAAGVFSVLALIGALIWSQFALGWEVRALAKLQKSQTRALSVSAIRKIQELEERLESDCFPSRPENIGSIATWIHDARIQVENLEKYRGYRDELRDDPGVMPELTEDEREWLLESLDRLVHDVERLADTGSATSMLRVAIERQELAESIEGDTIVAHEEDWADAIEAIAGSWRYGGLELAPQVGLIPLGENESSELWEFLLYETGDEPEFDPDANRFVMTEETGIVLVLIPGGRYAVGAQPGEVSQPNYDPLAFKEEAPVSFVELDSFFLSKYEMTQSQWVRIMGDNPSFRKRGGAYPIDSMSWHECNRTLNRVGLVLPTEAQWEAACRGGETDWWVGELGRCANIMDQTFARVTQDRAQLSELAEDWDDGYVEAAPVGSFEANPFGLHDVIGNLHEWCQDSWGNYGDKEARPGDGLRYDFPGDRLGRGGFFGSGLKQARPSSRLQFAQHQGDSGVGCRPALIIRPSSP